MNFQKWELFLAHPVCIGTLEIFKELVFDLVFETVDVCCRF